MGCIEGSLDLCGLVTVETDTGEDLPDLSGEPSESLISLECASNKPTAFILLDPTAGAAFAPSIITLPPICNRLRGLNEVEFVVETTLSVGLPGRSIADATKGATGVEGVGNGIAAEATEAGGDGMVDGTETRGELEAGTGDKAPLGSFGECVCP